MRERPWGPPPVRPEPCGSSLRPRAAAAAARAADAPVRAAVGQGGLGHKPGVRGARRDPGDPELPAGRASALGWCARAAPRRPPARRAPPARPGVDPAHSPPPSAGGGR